MCVQYWSIEFTGQLASKREENEIIDDSGMDLLKGKHRSIDNNQTNGDLHQNIMGWQPKLAKNIAFLTLALDLRQ